MLSGLRLPIVEELITGTPVLVPENKEAQTADMKKTAGRLEVACVIPTKIIVVGVGSYSLPGDGSSWRLVLSPSRYKLRFVRDGKVVSKVSVMVDTGKRIRLVCPL